MGLYDDLGIKTYINALDTVSIFGGSRMPDYVADAMQQAAGSFVEIAELQKKAGEQIARMTQNEAAYITAGASAALTMCAAICMAGHDVNKQKQLPDTTGMKNEFLIMKNQKTGYNRAINIAGGKTIFVDAGLGQSDQLRKAVTEQTAAIFYFDLYHAWNHSVSFEETVQVAKEFNLPLIVDAAAQLPPVENLWRFTHGGADAVCFSGGKGLRGPQGSGLVLGKKWIIDGVAMIGPPTHGIARSQKVGREEIVGVFTALEEYLKPGVVENKIAVIESRGQYIRTALDATGLFACERVYPGPTGQSYPYINAKIIGSFRAEDIVQSLREGEPGVVVGQYGDNGFFINLLLLVDDEVDTLIRCVIKAAIQFSQAE